MKNSRQVLTAAMALAAFSMMAPAAVAADSPDEGATVRVVNYHKAPVRLYVFDRDDRRIELGVVAAGDVEELAIPEALLEQGSVQVKAYPVATGVGLGSATEPGNGVKSSRLILDDGDVVDFWLEPTLENSMVRITRG